MITLEKQFNLFCGLTKEDDLLPQRFYTETISAGGENKILGTDEFSSMRKEYYKSFGWDEDGIPLKKTLSRLSISEFVNV